MLRRSTSFVAALAAAVLAGCDTTKELTVEFLPGQPDTVGAAVWQYLQGADYQANWQTWPGKGELYPAQAPHGMLLTTYLNDIASSALTNRAGSFPPGAIVVKENYRPDSTLDAVTTMYKVRNYNAAEGNWFWVKHLPEGTVAAAGKVRDCINCHAARSNNDYIYTAPLN